jgi:hypothetical protein
VPRAAADTTSVFKWVVLGIFAITVLGLAAALAMVFWAAKDADNIRLRDGFFEISKLGFVAMISLAGGRALR